MKRLFNTMVLSSLLSRLKQARPEEESVLSTTTRLADSRAGERIKNVNKSTNLQALEVYKWMENHGPIFSVDGNKVNVLQHPKEFYSTLLTKITQAKRRITLASLYLGTGELETELVNRLQSALSSNRIRLLILLDHSRGLRGNPNSCTMLQPLLKNEHCQIALFHTPTLRGLLKLCIPDRWNELFSLQHMKVYVFDDSVVISGANLSHDYFTNRQDRYFCIEDCPELADHMHNLVSTLSLFSLQLSNNGECNTHSAWKIHPFKGDEAEFKSKAREKVLALIQPNKPEKSLNNKFKDTLIMPLVQLGLFGISQDEKFTKELLNRSLPISSATMATGYFNLTNDYKSCILKSSTPISIVTASPTVNGFYGARGVAGAIPSAYTHLAHQFYKQILSYGQTNRVKVFEYVRPGWTFHSKGLWMYLKGESKPSLTLVGSPNFDTSTDYWPTTGE